ncbi:class I SAM-dependent methyltransferase [Desulfomicrobium escambiense]|uniref:class I SAM-dependent methyltransferase n=1 Tax=Desulfomicrobium escambiense TaxID=29503 RepID=UPI00040D4300|nr:class I SAM-dependent methyltransferase [Desulfomicrobium escambiense]
MYGSEKRHAESNLLKKIGYALLGELHVPGRLRAYHVQRKIRELGFAPEDGLRVLDAGCGRGDLVVSFSKANPSWQVTGIDLEPERIAIARAVRDRIGLKNAEYIEGSVLELSHDGRYDMVTCCDVLEHIQDDVSVMKKFHGSLKRGGVLLLTFPSIPQRRHLGLVKWRERRIGFSNEDYGHVRDGYSIDQIRGILTGIGFRDVACAYTFGLWGTLCFDLFFAAGDNRPNPVVFLLLFPVLMGLAFLDVHFPSRQGSALLVTAYK